MGLDEHSAGGSATVSDGRQRATRSETLRNDNGEPRAESREPRNARKLAEGSWQVAAGRVAGDGEWGRHGDRGNRRNGESGKRGA